MKDEYLSNLIGLFFTTRSCFFVLQGRNLKLKSIYISVPLKENEDDQDLSSYINLNFIYLFIYLMDSTIYCIY